MGTLHCHCGHRIYDGTLPHSYKAKFVTEDAFDAYTDTFVDAEDSPSYQDIDFEKLCDVLDRDLLQCTVCGRLYGQGARGDHSSWYCFVPESDDVPKTLFDARVHPTDES